MKKTTLEFRMIQENNRHKIPDSKLLTGSTSGKYPIVLDGAERQFLFRIKPKKPRQDKSMKYGRTIGLFSILKKLKNKFIINNSS